MKHKYLFVINIFFYCFVFQSAWADVIIHSKSNVKIKLVGFNGLAENTIFKGSISRGSKLELKKFPYCGLALLTFEKGQIYPVIFGDEHLYLKIINPSTIPSFALGSENDFFYKALSDSIPEEKQYDFALLMIEAKQLLGSSYKIRTIDELTAKKKEFQSFVSSNYEKLKYSDMIRRLMAQSFMMLEYVRYHVEGEPATKIKKRYLQNVISMTNGWFKVLKPHIPEHEVLNYIAGLYYGRSMVEYASIIIGNFPQQAYCQGNDPKELKIPENLKLTRNGMSSNISLDQLKGKKTVCFVSLQCPVSLVTALSQARRLFQQDQSALLVVVPLEKLSSKHLSMQRMLSHNNIYFVDDEEWRKEELPEKLNLPLFIQIAGNHAVEVAK